MHKLRNVRTPAFIVLAAVAPACASTQHQPSPGPRLSMVMDQNELALVRNGQRLDAHDEAAVAGNAAAAERLRDARSSAAWSVGTGLVSTAGLAYGIWEVSESKHTSDLRDGLGLGALALGFAGLVLTTWLEQRSLAAKLDAVNIYNDAMPFTPTLPPPGAKSEVPAATE